MHHEQTLPGLDYALNAGPLFSLFTIKLSLKNAAGECAGGKIPGNCTQWELHAVFVHKQNIVPGFFLRLMQDIF